MARRKNQQARRDEFMAATRRVIVRDGLSAVTVRTIAAEAGLSTGLVSYYFPDIDELYQTVYGDAVDRFATRRRRTVDAITDPRERLVAMIRSGLPVDPDDELCILLYEFSALVRRNPMVQVLRRSLYERQVSIYESILDVGQGLGVFTLAQPSTATARSMVSLEDAFGYHAVARVSVSLQDAQDHLLGYATIATGCRLAAVAGTGPG
ncbi:MULTISPECIES: TetR/AcrR family transcriptional regulator [unclassified Pseudonocardia]|uniref:TetR/AcrR family transcriptional regulator n=1 Tax=unclassified Pseudonocardia TaxID=2619320 RepID=UPI001CF65D00|nr:MULTISPECIES: TetR family transcriptional regulator [unclassified Pseudonocardia]